MKNRPISPQLLAAVNTMESICCGPMRDTRDDVAEVIQAFIDKVPITILAIALYNSRYGTKINHNFWEQSLPAGMRNNYELEVKLLLEMMRNLLK